MCARLRNAIRMFKSAAQVFRGAMRVIDFVRSNSKVHRIVSHAALSLTDSYLVSLLLSCSGRDPRLLFPAGKSHQVQFLKMLFRA